jgi:hypothetical protein
MHDALQRSCLVAVVLAGAVLLCGCTHRCAEQAVPATPDEEILVALDNLRQDDEKWNCHNAMWLLYERREEICPALVAALDADDWQVQEAVARILCETDAFQPDRRFIELLLARLAQPKELFIEAHHSIHYDFIAYLAEVAPEWHDVIAAGIRSDDLFVVWATTYALDRAGLLDAHRAGFTPMIVERIVHGLGTRGDTMMYAARTCLLLGDMCLPLLAEPPTDAQGGSALRELLVRAIAGSDREALDTVEMTYFRIESAYLMRASDWPRSFAPLSEVLPHNSRPLVRRPPAPTSRGTVPCRATS